MALGFSLVMKPRNIQTISPRWRPTEVDGPTHSLWKRSGPGQEDNDVVDGSRIENVEEDKSVVYLLHVRLDLESKMGETS